jgi:hypothetical protein
LVTDRDYFAHPTQTLFSDIRWHFPVSRQKLVYRIVERYLALADELVARMPPNGFDTNGNPRQCRALTRRGTVCQRMPLAANGYCPSHQHLAETEYCELTPNDNGATTSPIEHSTHNRPRCAGALTSVVECPLPVREEGDDASRFSQIPAIRP